MLDFTKQSLKLRPGSQQRLRTLPRDERTGDRYR